MDSKKIRRVFSMLKLNLPTPLKTTTDRPLFFALFLIFGLLTFSQEGDPVAG